MEFHDSDPVDWDVEGVVKFLCDPESRPWAEGSNIPFPKPADLAAALHENFITGEVLLEEVDRLSLKDDLGIKALGHRSGIMKAIEWLRIRSTKYQAKTRPSSLQDFLSPRSAFSPQIPHSRPLGSIATAPASEVPLVSSSGAGVRPSITPQGKRRIAPQLVRTFKKSKTSKENPPSPGGHFDSNNTNKSVPAHNHPTTQPPRTRQVNTAEDQPQFSQQAAPNHSPQPESIEQPEHIHEQATSRTPTEEAFLNSLLQKYPPEADDADLFPLYGDSGSEGQFDEETWEEMQIEAKELQENTNQPNPAEKASLSREECMELIANHIAQKEDLWKEKRLPKELPKAPKIWDRSHMNGSLEQDKSDLSRRIFLYQKRLEKLKAGLLEVDSKDRAFFLLSCASLDNTISDICLDKWTLQILELENRPPRVEPPPRIPKPQKEPLNFRDDESLASEMDTDLESSVDESESDESESEEGESDFIEIDLEDDSVHDQVDKPHKVLPFTLGSPPPADKPHKGLPFTLGSPPPADEQDLSTEPARKKRRIHDNESDGEITSDTGTFSEILRRGDVDTVDLTGALPTSASAAGSRSAAIPSSLPHPGTLNDAEDADEMQIETPPLNPSHSIVPQDADVPELSVDSTPTSPVRTVRVNLTMPRPAEPDSHNSRKTSRGDNDFLNGLSSIPENMMLEVDEDDLELFDDVKLLDFETIAASRDRVQLLAKSILGLRPPEAKLIRKFLDDFMLPQLMDLVHEALTYLHNDRASFPDRDENESLGIMRLAVLYHSWLHCIGLSPSGLDKKQVRDTISQIEEEAQSMFSTFVERLNKLFTAYDLWVLKNPGHSSGSHSASLASFLTGSKSNAKAKSKTKYAPRTPSNIQREAQVRQEKQEAMRHEREKRGLGNSDPDKQAVNFKEPPIYLHKDIGEHVKPHQLAGIQFMWRELIEAKKPQGCLLAHVMGLGKTMQV